MTCDRVKEIATCVMAFFVNLTCDMGKNTGQIHVTSFCLFFKNSTCDIAPPPIYLPIEWDLGLLVGIQDLVTGYWCRKWGYGRVSMMQKEKP